MEAGLEIYAEAGGRVGAGVVAFWAGCCAGQSGITYRDAMLRCLTSVLACVCVCVCGGYFVVDHGLLGVSCKL